MRKFLLCLRPFLINLLNPQKIIIEYPQRRWGRRISLVTRGKSIICIGRNLNCRDGLQIRALDGGRVHIGNNVFINTNVCITAFSEISIGDNCRIANNVVIVDHDHDFRNGFEGYLVEGVTIRDNVWIGANVVILRGVVIGSNAVIAAGAVVKHNVETGTIVGGVPAKKLGEV